MATDFGFVPTAKFAGAEKLPVPSPKKTERVFEMKLATTRSTKPSAFTSAAASPSEPDAPTKPVGPNDPVPVPMSTATGEPKSATARSIAPSPLKSGAPTIPGKLPAGNGVAAQKEPVPVPRRMETLFEV